MTILPPSFPRYERERSELAQPIIALTSSRMRAVVTALVYAEGRCYVSLAHTLEALNPGVEPTNRHGTVYCASHFNLLVASSAQLSHCWLLKKPGHESAYHEVSWKAERVGEGSWRVHRIGSVVDWKGGH